MKKDEMIHIGANVLDHKLDNMSNYEIAAAMLEAFLEAGMLPPAYEYIQIVGYDHNGKFLKEEGFCNEWEREE